MADDGFVERTVGDWTSYQDDDGGVYYHNAATGETSWDAPPGFEDGAAKSDPGDGAGGEIGAAQTPPLDRDAEDHVTKSPVAAYGGDAAAGGENEHDDDGVTKSPPAHEGETAAAEGGEGDEAAAADGEDIGGGWVAYRDEEGSVYYYHTESGETQWDRPDVGGAAAADRPEAAAPATPAASPATPDASPRPESPTASLLDGKDRVWTDDKGDGKTDGAGPTTPAGSPAAPEEPPPEEEDAPPPEEDPVERAEQFLRGPDAVMEPGVLDHINALVQGLGARAAGPKAMQSLMNGYGGDTAACGLMGRWLAELRSAGDGGGGGGVKDAPGPPEGTAAGERRFRRGADAARDVVEETVNRLAKERFTKDGGDAIVKLSKKDAAFVDDMIASARWRKLLIDLSATAANKDSKLFMYCLQKISNLGHHREIANRIDQSDYFGVFHSMLQSELGVAARVAVDGHARATADSVDAAGGDGGPSAMGSLVADLRRTCTSTSYTCLYAMEVLRELLSRANGSPSGKEGGGCPDGGGLRRASRKWERLREELEDEMLKPATRGTAFQRKRRIDVALTMSDLFQRKRRRGDPRDANNGEDGDGPGGCASSKSDLADALDAALSRLLTKNSLGMQIDKEVADDMLKFAYGGSTDRIGDLLIEHPTAVTALLRNLFGSKRIRLLETRLKCARLVALAVTASERRAGRPCGDREARDVDAGGSSDEDALSEVVLKASQLCERIENMVSFIVVEDVEGDPAGWSVGRQLCAMCVRHSVVAQGVLTWAREFASKSDFATMVSYPTISPCILSLARLICRHHPLTRPAVLDISLIFMGHSNREISHRKMSSIKEQCLRLMLWLMTQGLSLMVISAVQNKLERGGGGQSEMDSALVRYFFMGILEVARPPFSMTFVRALGGLMMARPFVDALQSKHFEDSKQSQTARLIEQFEATATGNFLSWEEDEPLMRMLKSTYCACNNQ